MELMKPPLRVKVETSASTEPLMLADSSIEVAEERHPCPVRRERGKLLAFKAREAKQP
jgi:hypothetical protein